MDFHYKLLLFYNFIRCFIGLYYHIFNLIKIIDLPYSGMIHLYFILSWAILLYLIYSSVKSLNNKFLLFMIAFQFIWGICYISITPKLFVYICYDAGINIFIYYCFLSYQLWYNKKLQNLNKNNTNNITTNQDLLINSVEFHNL